MRIGICGNYGVSNIGDEAILRGLRLLCERVFPGSQITIFGRGMHFPFGKRSLLRSIFQPELWKQPYRALKQCDFFILGGGGLFTDEESFFQPVFWSLQGLMAVALGKRLVCLGISVGHLNWFNKLFVKTLLNRSRIVTVRDWKSHKTLESWGIKSHLSSDLSLFMDPRIATTDAERSDTEKYVVVNVRPFKNNNENLYKIIAQVCDRIVSEYGLGIRLVALQDYGQNDSLVSYKIFEQVRDKSKITVQPFTENFEDISSVLGGAEVVLGMRLHAGILSLLSGAPFISFDYMEKVPDFWSEFDHVNVVNVASISIDDLMQIFQEVYNNRREHRAKNNEILKILAKRAKLSEEILFSLYKNVD